MNENELAQNFQAVVTDLADDVPPRLDAEKICAEVLADSQLSGQPLPLILTHWIGELDSRPRPSTFGEGAERVLAFVRD